MDLSKQADLIKGGELVITNFTANPESFNQQFNPKNDVPYGNLAEYEVHKDGVEYQNSMRVNPSFNKEEAYVYLCELLDSDGLYLFSKTIL